MMDGQQTSIEPSRWARLFGQVTPNYRKAKVLPDGIAVYSGGQIVTIRFDQIAEITSESGWFWGRLRISLSNKKRPSLSGIPKRRLKKILDRLSREKDQFLSEIGLARKHSVQIKTLADWIDHRLQGEHWVSHHELENIIPQCNDLSPVLSISPNRFSSDPALARSITLIHTFADNPEWFRQKANKVFVPAELERFQRYFQIVETKPLTEAQRIALVTHEDNTRVIAGAGSGKTSVIVAKTGYLLKKELCQPEQILLIAFNKAAAEELQKRIQKRIGSDITTSTFHALGLGIIAQVQKRKPSLAKSAESERTLQNLIRDLLTELIRDPAYSDTVRRYFQSFFAPYRSQFEFKTLGDYYAYLKANELITLKGETVKSFEEIEIANFLCLNGIDYRYEQSYEVDTATITHRQYQPDFYLPEPGIYIEHFGIQRNGSTPPFIDQTEYTEGMKWKRELHRQNDTKLIETYSYQKQEGTLLTGLEKELRKSNVEFRPISPEEVLAKLGANNRMDEFSRLSSIFLNHFKGGGHSVDKVRARAKLAKQLDGRTEAFLKVFAPLLECYEETLRKNGEIDFNDMIIRAAEYVENGSYRSPYTCILVDEFQDISTGRARLVKALADQSPSHRVFCVGDDWQAIYRFAGSDIALMRDFQPHFGFTETVALDRTFRFNNRIEKVATRFVLANPAQIKKTIVTQKTASEPRVIIHRPEAKGEQILMGSLREIQRQIDGKRANVLLLGRYNFLKDGLPWTEIKHEFPQLKVSFKTIHGAKGLEADYVVVLGMQAGKYGFPSEISDDPLLNIVLAEPEDFPHSEERRLFYVALTRARHAVHLIADHVTPSAFLKEIMEYSGDIDTRGTAAVEPTHCPNCQGGTLTQRSSEYGIFYSCSNYPLCTYKVNACSRCGAGLLVHEKAKGIYACNSPNCNHTEWACPSCETGRLVERNGKYGPFLGCTNYSRGTCKYTKKITH